MRSSSSSASLADFVTQASHKTNKYHLRVPIATVVLSVIEQLDGKTIIMSMLSHDDTNVKHQALLCIQKLMVHHW